MQKLRTQKGITLIALIITIIVMLILVGVSVTVALNGGLFTTAQNAKENTIAEREKELALDDGKVIIGDQEYDSIYDYTGTGTGNGSVTAVTFTVAGGKSLSDLDPEANIGTVVTASNDEEFYYIGTENGKVKLLAAKCVDTSTKKQSDTYNYVVFDTETNEYANASIRELVEDYVTTTLGLNANEGRLMLKSEAEALETRYTNILCGTTTEWKYWLGNGPREGDAWCVEGIRFGINDCGVAADDCMGLRPVIEISLSDI